MKKRPFQTPQPSLRDSVTRAAMASAKMEQMMRSEKDPQKAMEKVMAEIKKQRF